MKTTGNLIIFLFLVSIVSCKKSGTTNTPPPNPPSTANYITSFILTASDNPGLPVNDTATINNDTIRLTVPYGANVSSLKPTITIIGTSVNPPSGIGQNFSGSVNYIVTAESGAQRTYVVIVKVKVKSMLFIASANKLYALDGDSGNLKWSLTLAGQVTEEASPAYYNGLVYIATTDGKMNAVDAVSGIMRWTYLTDGSASYVTPAINSGILYFGGSRAPFSTVSLYALNASTGALVWKYLPGTNLSPLGNPTIKNGRIFVAGNLQGLFCFDANTGTLLSSLNGSICGSSNPLVINNTVYAPTETSIITAYNSQSGAVVWTYGSTLGTGVKCSPTYHNGKIFNACSNSYLYALDTFGNMKWRYIPDYITNSYFSSPIVANGMVYAGNTDSYFFALDENTGVKKWQTLIPSSGLTYLQSNCTIKDDLVFVGSSDNNLYALNAFTGAITWQFNTGAPVYGGACVLAEDQTVYHPGISGEQQ